MEEGGEVVGDVMGMKKEKGVNGSEKKMVDEGDEFLVSELEVMKGIREKEMKSLC